MIQEAGSDSLESDELETNGDIWRHLPGDMTLVRRYDQITDKAFHSSPVMSRP
jgi:hypothetical protein